MMKFLGWFTHFIILSFLMTIFLSMVAYSEPIAFWLFFFLIPLSYVVLNVLYSKWSGDE